MMHESEKSDLSIVAVKPANNSEGSEAGSVERREEAEGNTIKHRTHRTQSRASVYSGLERVRERARTEKKGRFTALLHHVDVDLLRAAFSWLKQDAAPGVDGLTWRQYEQNLEANLVDLHARIHRRAYRAQPSRRKFIPKADGLKRPLGIAALEDKIVQRALVEVFNAICEQDFLGFSYGFRPGRSPHDALDALAVGITRTQVNWILDVDVRAFFDTVSHEWLVRFVEHRIGDPRVIRLIRKWLKAGVMDEGEWTASEAGTPQGAVISPMLANIYLHYAFDLWAERWRGRNAQGTVILVRFADDIVAGFEHESDAVRFLAELRERLEKFALTLHPEKTRLIEFGRHAASRRASRGLGKPETFTFLGFTHICGRSRRGLFSLHRKTRRDRMRAKLRALKAQLKRRMHEPIPQQGRWLAQVVRGYFAYHAVPTNTQRLRAFRYHVTILWRRTLQRRSQKDWTTWDRISRLVEAYLPHARILHLGLMFALPSSTLGGSPVRESRPPGSVRGAPGDGCPYRDSAGPPDRFPPSLRISTICDSVKVIGAVGASGGSVEQDVQVAGAAVAEVKPVLGSPPTMGA
jgi:RNA-directed DNA polymerase